MPPITRAPLLRLWTVLALVLGAALFWANRDLFAHPAYEEGDHAANALSIARAKHGAELLGNYSRFRFHHPGPAFFYVYAAGEWVLYDLFHAVPARHNAHLLTGMALQSAFLAALVTLLAAATSRPHASAWFLLAATLIPLSVVPGLFSDVWPPYVLLLPLATLVVSAATLAAGERRGWAGLIVSAGFLLHGHVAQPLFVGPLLLVGFLGLWWSAGRPTPRRWTALLPPPPTRWLLAAVLALFALPLLLDLARGFGSNLVHIVQHFLAVEAKGLPAWNQALEYTLSFLAFAHDQERWWHAAAPVSASWWAEHWQGAAAGLALATAATGAVWRSRRDTAPAGRLVRALAVCWLLVLGLALVWARRQDGGLLNFNSHFLFGLAALLPVFPLLAWAQPLARVPAWLAAGAGLLVVLIVSPRFRSPAIEKNAIANAIAANLPALLATDPQPGAPKLLLFPNERWYEAVTLATTLQRAGVPFFITDDWAFMFGESHTLAAAPAAERTGVLSAWSVEPGPASGADARPLTADARLRFAAPSRLPPASLSDLSFGGPQPAGAFPVIGVAPGDGDGAWTESRFVWLRWQWERRTGAQELVLEANALSRKRPQRVEIWLNRRRLATWSFDPQRTTQHVIIPPEIWALGESDGTTDLRLYLPDATPPATYKASHWREHRRLGVRLFRLQILPAS